MFVPVPGLYDVGRCRSLFPWEERRYRDHLIGLSDADRGLRFMGAVTEECIATHAHEAFVCARSKVIGWFQGSALKGAVELNWTPDRLCEATFNVGYEYRSRGVGTMLARRAIRAARNRGMTRMVIFTETGNVAMRRLGRKFQAQFRFDGGESEGVIDIGHANPLSVIIEMTDEAGFTGLSSFADQGFAFAGD